MRAWRCMAWQGVARPGVGWLGKAGWIIKRKKEKAIMEATGDQTQPYPAWIAFLKTLTKDDLQVGAFFTPTQIEARSGYPYREYDNTKSNFGTGRQPGMVETFGRILKWRPNEKAFQVLESPLEFIGGNRRSARTKLRRAAKVGQQYDMAHLSAEEQRQVDDHACKAAVLSRLLHGKTFKRMKLEGKKIERPKLIDLG